MYIRAKLLNRALNTKNYYLVALPNIPLFLHPLPINLELYTLLCRTCDVLIYRPIIKD